MSFSRTAQNFKICFRTSDVSMGSKSACNSAFQFNIIEHIRLQDTASQLEKLTCRRHSMCDFSHPPFPRSTSSQPCYHQHFVTFSFITQLNMFRNIYAYRFSVLLSCFRLFCSWDNEMLKKKTNPLYYVAVRESQPVCEVKEQTDEINKE